MRSTRSSFVTPGEKGMCGVRGYLCLMAWLQPKQPPIRLSVSHSSGYALTVHNVITLYNVIFKPYFPDYSYNRESLPLGRGWVTTR